MKMDRSQPEEALAYLREVAGSGRSEEMRHIGRLRAARVLAEQQKFDEALAELKVPADSAYAARFHEVRGDVYQAMGKAAESRDSTRRRVLGRLASSTRRSSGEAR
jgi:predicted negative regulator of RcsB-dependent stress response